MPPGSGDTGELLGSAIVDLLRHAAHLWARGMETAAERFVRAAWSAADGCTFIDNDAPLVERGR